MTIIDKMQSNTAINICIAKRCFYTANLTTCGQQPPLQLLADRLLRNICQELTIAALTDNQKANVAKQD